MTGYVGVLHKLRSDHSELRTDSMRGTFMILPEKGKHFAIVGEPLDPTYDGRLITTSTIQEVNWLREGQDVVFKTRNSTYNLKIDLLS